MTREQLGKHKLPDAPGVYLFTSGKGTRRKVLYVGKATSLRDRVRSYFDVDLIATRGPRIVDMVTRADGLMHEVTPTVLEALVREAALIRRYYPPANAIGKDDRSFLYACITKEEMPRVLMIRGHEIDFDKKISGSVKLKGIYGPFPSGVQLKEALRLIRRIFPYFDTKRPILPSGARKSSKHLHAHIEFNTQIGRYPRGISKQEYARNIRHIALFLSGDVKKLRRTLEKEMKALAKAERFEEAGELKRQLFALDHVQDIALIKDEHVRKEQEASTVRVEAYDTAHLRATNAIGVMTVLVGGEPVKKEYRTFKIRSMHGKEKDDDLASLKELLERRLAHPEWPLPRLFVVDGGRTHKKTAEAVLAEAGVAIPVAAVVKDEKHRPKGIFKTGKLSVHDADIILANAEAHRFSLSLHRRARSRPLKK